MNAKRATEILTSLVEGIDPLSKEELPRQGVLQNAEVLRALLAGATALQEQTARAARRALLPVNVGNTWTDDEERQLLESYKSGDSLALIAERLGRTLRAIEARLERLGLLTKEERVTQSPFESSK